MFTKLASWFQGRHTLFLVACMGIGTAMAWFDKLSPNLVTLLLGLQGLVLAHSAKEDYFNGHSISAEIQGKESRTAQR